MTIDSIKADPRSGELLLCIEHSQQWDEQHLFALQEKINSYMAFIQSGEIFVGHPEAMEAEMVIQVVHTHPPTPAALAFLQAATAVIEDTGILFRFGPAAA